MECDWGSILSQYMSIWWGAYGIAVALQTWISKSPSECSSSVSGMKFIFHSTTWSSRQKEKEKNIYHSCARQSSTWKKLDETYIIHLRNKSTLQICLRQVNGIQKSYPFQNGRLEFSPTRKRTLSSIHLFRIVMASFKSTLPWSLVLNMAYIPTKIPIFVNAGYLPAPQSDFFFFFFNSYCARAVACRASFICTAYCDHQVWVHSRWNSQAFPSHLLGKALNSQSQKWSKEQLLSPPLWAAHRHAFSNT